MIYIYIKQFMFYVGFVFVMVDEIEVYLTLSIKTIMYESHYLPDIATHVMIFYK